MTIVSLVVSDENNPTEIQTWLTNNSSATIHFILNDGRIFFIFYS